MTRHICPTALIERLDQICDATAIAISENPTGRRLLEGRFDRALYIRLLRQSYHYVLRTAPWLARAAQRSADPHLRQALAQKAHEEADHDQWILSDLARLGEDISEAGAWPRCPALDAYVAWHDFVVEGSCPEAILGAAFLLERLGEAHAGRLAEHVIAGGLDAKATTFMSGHGDADIEHMRELRELLRYVRDPRLNEQITLSALVTAEAYLGLIASLGI